MDIDLLIDGELVRGQGPAERIVDPATGEAIVEVPEASEAQVAAAVAAAARAFDAWSRTTPAERSGLMLKLADAIERRGPDLAAVESRNWGKPLARAAADEIPAIVDVGAGTNGTFFASGIPLSAGCV